MIKPFLLINASELQDFQQLCTRILNAWNNEYSHTPLTVEITKPCKDYCPPAGKLLQTEHHAIAFVSDDYLDTMNQALFATVSACFNAVSQQLFFTLLQRIFAVDSCAMENTVADISTWFYPGSSCLVLQLTCATSHCTVILNPSWVYKHVAHELKKNTKQFSLDKALAQQKIKLNLELQPLNLPVTQLLNLQVGDVIATDHPLVSPLQINHEGTLLTYAELGQSSHHKSIILKR